MEASDQITELLTAWSDGDESSLEILMPLVERELRRMAHKFMRGEDENHTLQTTALVNEAFLKLVDQTRVNWQNRTHFYAISARIMRRVLLNHARERRAGKRGGGDAVHVGLEEVDVFSTEKSAELIALDDALEKLQGFDKLKSRIVELRYFGGLTLQETAETLGIAVPTVSLHWRLARAWLAAEIEQ